MIPYGRQNITEEDIGSVIDVLKSDFLTQGPLVPKFEGMLCEYAGSMYGVAVNSGASALHVACKALGLGKGDWLWTSPISFVASANCGLYCGAQVDFVDIDSSSWNLDVDKLERKLRRAKDEDKLPKVLVAVHLCGLPCDMEYIHALSRKYDFHIIEDACHAIGGTYQDEPIGSCRYSDITVFSFHPVKTITTGEGGMAVTNNFQFAESMRLFRNHGITHDPEWMTKDPDGPWYYQQIDLGYNYKMTDIEAALGISQLKKINEFVAKRHEIASRYDETFANLPLQLPLRQEGKYSGMHLYVVRVKENLTKMTHLEIFKYLRQQGIGVNLHYIPIHMQPYYQNMGFRIGDFPCAEDYYSEALSIPMYTGLTDDDIKRVVAALKNSLR